MNAVLRPIRNFFVSLKLTVVLLADDETSGLRPTGGAQQAGVDELQLGRLVLDRCATVDEAKAVLYETKQYDRMVPCHYLIADANGDAFVWERDTHNIEHVVDAGTGVFCVTNYLLHRYNELTGRNLTLDELRVWEVFGNVKWAIGCLTQSRRHLNRQDRSVEYAVLGRMAAEMEYELLDLIGHAP